MKAIMMRSTEEFVSKAEAVHGALYEYSKVDYINSSTKVTIVCKTHGDFTQTPNSHLSGRGCPKCAGGIASNTGEFIEKAKIVHGGLYDYSKVVYKTSNQKIEVICREHGSFFPLPNNLLRGQGCPDCGRLKCGYSRSFFTGHSTTLYVLQLTNGLFKVGITKHSVNERYSKKDQELIQEVILEYVDCGDGESWELEKLTLRKYREFRYKGINILQSGNTELLSVNPLEFINENISRLKPQEL